MTLSMFTTFGFVPKPKKNPTVFNLLCLNRCVNQSITVSYFNVFKERGEWLDFHCFLNTFRENTNMLYTNGGQPLAWVPQMVCSLYTWQTANWEWGNAEQWQIGQEKGTELESRRVVSGSPAKKIGPHCSTLSRVTLVKWWKFFYDAWFPETKYSQYKSLSQCSLIL